MIDAVDTLKTSGVGVSGWLPELVSLMVGIATLVYLVVKIRKELK